MNKEPRNFAVAERRGRFTAHVKDHPPNTVENSKSATLWYVIDDPLTPDQCDQLPPARPGVDSRTASLWLKFIHPWTRKIVISEGRFDYDGGIWTAVLQRDDEEAQWGRIAPVAWASIVPGQAPWDGAVISRWHDGPQGNSSQEVATAGGATSVILETHGGSPCRCGNSSPDPRS